MKKELPDIIKEVGFDFSWDNRKVWELDVPVEEMDIDDLAWHFDIPFWDKTGGYYNLTPNEVLAKPEEFKEEFERTMAVDMSHPLDIMHWRGRWLMLDGLHRLVKARHLGRQKIKVRKIPKESIPQIKKDE